MQKFNLKIIPVDLLENFHREISGDVETAFEKLHDSHLSQTSFSFYTSVSAVFSSKIEGENIEFDSFIKHKRFGAHFQPDYTRKTDDLYDAYLFAQQNKLTASSIEKSHALLTKHILQSQQRGRTSNMFVTATDGNIEYVAAAPDLLKEEMDKLYSDIKTLLSLDLSFKEVLFFAAMIHLVFVKIHPFEDGNGRTSRLLEKWFVAEKLGAKAWFIQSEKYYYTYHQTYYNNIRKLGLEYPDLDYTKALEFLLMLPKSVNEL